MDRPISEEMANYLQEFDEEHIDFVELRNKRGPQKQDIIHLSQNIVRDVVGQLTKSELIQADIMSAITSAPEKDLTEKLLWLNQCLQKRSIILSSTREKVWASYHRQLWSNLRDMSVVLGSKRTASILALHCMKALVAINYSDAATSTTNEAELTDPERDILDYISGYLLRRFKNTDEAKACMGDGSSIFLNALDRGGLTRPNPEFCHIVSCMENVFRGSLCDQNTFNAGLEANNIASQMMALLEYVESSEESKENFYLDVTNLFFIVRAHQQCRFLVEKSKKDARVPKSKKALRDSL